MMLLAVVLGMLAVPARIALGILGVLVVAFGAGRSPAGEDLVDLVAPAARFLHLRVRGRDEWCAALTPWCGLDLPPLFSGIALADCDPRRLGRSGSAFGVVSNRADGAVSVVLRVHGEGFLLADHPEQEARLAAFGDALASLGREDYRLYATNWGERLRIVVAG